MTIDNVQIHGPKVLFTLPIFGGLDFNETVVNSWIIIAVVFVLCKVLTHKLEKVPTKRTQQIAEIIVTTIDKLVLSTMGKRNMKFAPYILTLMIYSVFGSLIGLVGLRSVTSDLCATLTWGVVTFLLIHISGIKAHGLKHFKGLIEPIPLLLPINILSEVATPVSMGLRHFCNIIAGSIITTLLYAALATAAVAIFGYALPIFQIGLPAVLSIYFDLFSGCIQAFVFSMLTMVFVSNANDVEEA